MNERMSKGQMDETTLSGPMMWPDWMIATNMEYTEKRVDF